jgi:hypothetical protein
MEKKKIRRLARLDSYNTGNVRLRTLPYALPSHLFYRYPYRDDDDGSLCNFTPWACDNKDRLNGRVRVG